MPPQFAYKPPSCCPDGCGGCCVEVALNVPGIVSLRDPQGRTVEYNHDEWKAFLDAVKRNEYELPV